MTSVAYYSQTENMEGWIRHKIVTTLEIYPRLSPSMLQIGIGASVPPSKWRPVLAEMIKEGTVKKEEIQVERPNRFHTYVVLSFANQPNNDVGDVTGCAGNPNNPNNPNNPSNKTEIGFQQVRGQGESAGKMQVTTGSKTKPKRARH